jgi:hypothetical protein
VRRRFLHPADRKISLLLLAALISELVSEYAIRQYRNNMPVFHVWSPIELFIICIYFEQRISFIKQYRIGRIIGCMGIVLAILNAIFFQPITTINSVFLLFEGFSIIGLSLFAFYRLVLEEAEIMLNPHFWFSTILLIFWSSVFVYWGIYPMLLTSLSAYMKGLTSALWTINICCYLGMATVFFLYKKMSITSG